ncbi:MAG: hypothetical protein B6I30_04785 [Desulfobacteraceae bacterium 4572_187]|nr:MAG: hypothetical protein B6I30_04785 [Desulfobacteraceae bacterium 4572_187]
MFGKNLVTVHGLFETQNSKRQRSIKSQISSTKFQTNLPPGRRQTPNSKPVQSDCLFVWDFEFRSL